MYEDVCKVSVDRNISNETVEYSLPSCSTLSPESSASNQCCSVREIPMHESPSVDKNGTDSDNEKEEVIRSELPPDKLIIPLLLQGPNTHNGMITAEFLIQLRLLFNKVQILERHDNSGDYCSDDQVYADRSVNEVEKKEITSAHTTHHVVNTQGAFSLGLGFVDLSENVNIMELKMWEKGSSK